MNKIHEFRRAAIAAGALHCRLGGVVNAANFGYYLEQLAARGDSEYANALAGVFSRPGAHHPAQSRAGN